MDSRLFRKKNVDRLSSPEQLNEYIRVARPGVWLVLAAIVLLLVGVIVWGVFGTVETRVPASVYLENGEVLCYIREADGDKVRGGMDISIGHWTGKVKTVARQPEQAGEDMLLCPGIEEGKMYRQVEMTIPDLEDGAYSAQITVERITPISFVLQ